MRNFKNFMFMAIGLGLVLTGCNNDNNGGNTAVDNRDKVVGTYPVAVTVSQLPTPFTTNLTIAKEGNSDLKASTSVELPVIGAMNIDVVLSELKEFNEEGGKAVTGYLFKIAEKTLTIMGTPMLLKGTGSYDGYDGKIYKGADDAFVSLEIGGGTGPLAVTVKVETPAAE
jgi:hypothetical protein